MKKLPISLSLLLLFTLILSACTAIAPGGEVPVDISATPGEGSMAQMEQDEMPASSGQDSTGQMGDDPAHADARQTEASQDAMAEGMGEDAMLAAETPEAMPPGEGSEDAMDGESAMLDVPDWYGVVFTEAQSGETFTISDYQGKVILVETMAIWCSNCLQQQKQVKALHDLLGEREDFISLGLGIDPNEDLAMLQAYVQRHEFNWVYAISPPEVSREIAQLYGTQFLNPPSTPMLIIDRHGAAHSLPFGIKSAADLQTALQPYLDEAG